MVHHRFLCSVAVLLCSTVQAAMTVTVRPGGPAARPAAYQRMEWVVEVDKVSANPFDPQELAVDAVFSGPEGRSVQLPAFWMQEHRREVAGGRERLVEAGEAHWRIRFCPAVAGEWRLVVTARTGADSGKSLPLSFSVEPSKHPGFVRRVADNPRYLQFDNGQPYFVVGMNVCWAGRRGLGDYEAWFGKLGAAGGNFARLWMAFPSRPTETKKLGAGRYDLEACAFYDQVLDLADRNGIRCMLALGTYGDLHTGGSFNEGQWPISPYNAANGGPATRPIDLFTSAKHRKLYQRRLRYLIARYSAFTSLAFWEFWNEQDGVPNMTIPPDWTAEMAGYLKANDPWRRLVTTSYVNAGQREVWKLADIDLTQRHLYGDHEAAGGMYDRVPAVAAAVRGGDAFAKPHLIGELGICWRDSDGKHDPSGSATNLHNGLWASAMSGAAGGAANWYWDNYVAPKDLWGRFTGLAKFAAAIDWPRCHFQPIEVRSPMFTGQVEETFSAVTLPASSGWGKGHGKVITVGRDGSPSAEVGGFLYGPEKKDLRSPLLFQIDLPKASQMTVRVGKVSDHATVRVLVDEKPAAEWPFSAKPGSPDLESTKQFPEFNNIYQGIFNKDRTIDLPAGAHRISLELADGDWLSISSVSFTNARSSRYTGLRVLALADERAGQTIAWVQDPASHCGSDASGQAPRRYENAILALPSIAGKACQVEWWDTREGRVIRAGRAEPEGAMLALPMPAFSRDIAVRVRPAD